MSGITEGEIMTTMQERIEKIGLKMTLSPAEKNPHMDQDAWHASATHWRVAIKNTKTGEIMRSYFSQGSAHTKPPTLEEVLDCLASDATGYENTRSFEDWCGEYGYDTDSRKAERTYRIIGHQAEELKQVLGNAYEAVLFETERL